MAATLVMSGVTGQRKRTVVVKGYPQSVEQWRVLLERGSGIEVLAGLHFEGKAG